MANKTFVFTVTCDAVGNPIHLQDWLDFRRNENPRPIALTCCECGQPAQGNVSYTDGSGELCDECGEVD